MHRALAEVSSIEAQRIEGLTGVWVGNAKVAATGIRVQRWVAYHGIALNVCPDLDHFLHIVPCGIGDRPVTSVAQLLGAEGGTALLDEYAYALLDSFGHIFGLDLHDTVLPCSWETTVSV